MGAGIPEHQAGTLVSPLCLVLSSYEGRRGGEQLGTAAGVQGQSLSFPWVASLGNPICPSVCAHLGETTVTNGRAFVLGDYPKLAL